MNPIIIKNCPILEPVPERSNLLKEHLNLKSTDKIIIYQGTINMSRGLHKLVHATLLFPTNLHLVLIRNLVIGILI